MLEPPSGAPRRLGPAATSCRSLKMVEEVARLATWKMPSALMDPCVGVVERVDVAGGTTPFSSGRAPRTIWAKHIDLRARSSYMIALQAFEVVHAVHDALVHHQARRTRDLRCSSRR